MKDSIPANKKRQISLLQSLHRRDHQNYWLSFSVGQVKLGQSSGKFGKQRMNLNAYASQIEYIQSICEKLADYKEKNSYPVPEI